jgi:hypothetical protein
MEARCVFEHVCKKGKRLGPSSSGALPDGESSAVLLVGAALISDTVVIHISLTAQFIEVLLARPVGSHSLR